MKIFGTISVSYMQGRDGTKVFYGGPRKKYSIARTYAVPAATANTLLRGQEMQHIAALYRSLDPTYLADGASWMKTYLAEHPPSTEDKANSTNFFSMFVKMFYTSKYVLNSAITIKTVSLAQFVTAHTGCDNISSQCLAGLLPLTTDYEDYSNSWVA